LINRFKDSKDKNIFKYLSHSYYNLAELKFFSKNYEESIKLIRKGVILEPSKKEYWKYDIIIAHNYLLLGRIKEAKEIYIKHKKQKENIINDFQDYNISTHYFQVIENILN
jgi:tetratricopeptide (TPR) repeat protein